MFKNARTLFTATTLFFLFSSIPISLSQNTTPITVPSIQSNAASAPPAQQQSTTEITVPKLDTSSKETVKSSLTKMRSTLNDSDNKNLEHAIRLLMLSQVDLNELIAGKVQTEDFAFETLKKYGGKNAKQLISAADEIKEVLAQIKVTKSRFYITKDQFNIHPIIELTIKNSTDKAISRVFFKGVLASTGRSVPWIKEGFQYNIAGGLEPGEMQTWGLDLNMFSSWGKTNAPKDAILTLTVLSMTDAEGKTLSRIGDEDDAPNSFPEANLIPNYIPAEGGVSP